MNINENNENDENDENIIKKRRNGISLVFPEMQETNDNILDKCVDNKIKNKIKHTVHVNLFHYFCLRKCIK